MGEATYKEILAAISAMLEVWTDDPISKVEGVQGTHHGKDEPPPSPE